MMPIDPLGPLPPSIAPRVTRRQRPARESNDSDRDRRRKERSKDPDESDSGRQVDELV